MEIKSAGTTVRNAYFYRANVAKQTNDAVLTSMVDVEISAGAQPLLTDTPTRFYNNTGWIPGPTSHIGTAAPVLLTANGVVTNENNVFFAPDLTAPVGASFAPLGTSAISGFQCRFKGGRWNFPPIGSPEETTPKAAPNVNDSARGGWQRPVTAYREGGAGTVANLEWVSLPYPNYTGLSGGALGQVTQAIVTGNSTQRHQVSITGSSPRRMGDSTLWPEADGSVAFQFTPTAIRIQNRTGSPWSSGFIWVQLDLSDYLMSHEAGSANPPDIPAPIPGANSAARVTGRIGLWAYDDFLGTARGTQTVIGAFQPPA
jgi:hypothetical protein